VSCPDLARPAASFDQVFRIFFGLGTKNLAFSWMARVVGSAAVAVSLSAQFAHASTSVPVLCDSHDTCRNSYAVVCMSVHKTLGRSITTTVNDLARTLMCLAAVRARGTAEDRKLVDLEAQAGPVSGLWPSGRHMDLHRIGIVTGMQSVWLEHSGWTRLSLMPYPTSAHRMESRWDVLRLSTGAQPSGERNSGE
jgi:hypothetical protein